MCLDEACPHQLIFSESKQPRSPSMSGVVRVRVQPVDCGSADTHPADNPIVAHEDPHVTVAQKMIYPFQRSRIGPLARQFVAHACWGERQYRCASNLIEADTISHAGPT